MRKPPTISTGDQIDLNPLADKAIAIRVTNRRIVETRYGNRPMVSARIYVLGQREPLEGVLFATFFARHLELNEWYCGIVTKEDQRWILKPAPQKSEQALAKMIDSESEVPF